MKNLAMHVLAYALVFTMTAVVANTQTVGLRVDIPFNFNVAENALPAGHYLILAPQGQTLRILGPNGVAAVTVANPVSGKRPQGAGAVAFNCYGRRCFLSQFWTARTETGQQVPKCRIEKALATEKEQLAVITLKATPYR